MRLCEREGAWRFSGSWGEANLASRTARRRRGTPCNRASVSRSCERACGSTTRFVHGTRDLRAVAEAARCNRRGASSLFGGIRKLDEAHELLLAVDVRLLVDVADVGFRGAFRDVELFLDVRGVVPLRQKEHDLRLAPGKQVGVGNRLALRAEAAASLSLFALVCSACAAEFQQRRGAPRGRFGFGRDLGVRCRRVGRCRRVVSRLRGRGGSLAGRSRLP